jgi:HEAT repeat protein
VPVNSINIDPYTFIIAILLATIFWWLLSKARPLWSEARKSLAQRSATAQARRSSTIEQNYRRITFRRAQAMHLAASIFPLNDILIEPLLITPPVYLEPGVPSIADDLVTQTVPYLPAWTELAAVYKTAALTIDQALQGGSHLVIIGQPGIGKTVALAHLASLAANEDGRLRSVKNYLPVLLHVADLKLPIADARNVLNPIIDLISSQVPLLDMPRVPAFITNGFKSGHVLFLLDGFDELTSEGQQEVSQFLKLLLQSFPKIQVITTGAPEYLDGLIGLGFSPLSILSWSDHISGKFILRWASGWSNSIANEMMARTTQVQVDPLLLTNWLSTDFEFLTPLELTLKVWAGFAGDVIGPHPLEAISAHIRRIAPPGLPLAALDTLAMQAVLSAQPVFDPRSARSWVREFETTEELDGEESNKPTPEDDLVKEPTETGKRRKTQKLLPKPTSGLLGRLVSSGMLVTNIENRMRFIHPVFLGFLAGRGLSTNKGNDAILNQPDWSGKYLAMRYLAAHGDPGSIVQKLLEWSRLPMHRPVLAAARWLRDAPRDSAWSGKIFATLAALLQTEGIPLGLRGQAVAAFMISGDPGAAALFRKMAATNSFELVQLAVLGSGGMKDSKAIPVLEKVLGAPSLSARRAACMALVAIGTNEALELVGNVLLNDEEDMRRAAAEALANHPGEGHAMLKDGITYEDILLRRAAAFGIARVEEEWAERLLQKVQVEDEQWVVRNAAAEGIESRANGYQRAPRRMKAPSESRWLIEFAAKQGMGISPGKPATDLLLQALKDDDPDTRLAAMPYLKLYPTDGVIGQLYNAMYRDDPELREAVYLTLWEIGASGVKLAHPSQYGLN